METNADILASLEQYICLGELSEARKHFDTGCLYNFRLTKTPPV